MISQATFGTSTCFKIYDNKGCNMPLKCKHNYIIYAQKPQAQIAFLTRPHNFTN